MNLRYIAIGLDRQSFDSNYRYQFDLHTRFISNYLSKQIRKAKFKTDGTFNMIWVGAVVREPRPCQLVAVDVLESEVPFDKERYERIKGKPDCEYYLEMFEQGFRKAALFKKVPLTVLLASIDEFRKKGCRNEWLHKMKRFKEIDIEVTLQCYFTTLNFKLAATIKRISTQEELCAGIVLRTDPDELAFDYKFKDILIDEDSIIITDRFDRPRILIDLEKVMNGRLVSTPLPDEPKTEEEPNEPEIGMIKLYKNQDGAVNYYEAWDDNQRIVVHWGEVGDVGESRIAAIQQGETVEDAIKRESAVARSDGYREIEVNAHRLLVIQYETGSGGTERDLKKRHKVESLVNECLGWTGNGHCDGGQIGSGSIEIFAYVIDPIKACGTIVDELSESDMLTGAVIAVESENQDFVVLYPKEFCGEFRLV